MDRPTQVKLDWLSGARTGAGPIYLRIVDALRAASGDGRLSPGDRLPAQRAAAAHLGVDLTTISRAYNAAREAGLIDGAVGRGTFVRSPPEDETFMGPIDLSMNVPPPVKALGPKLSATLQEMLAQADASTLMNYHRSPAAPGQAAMAEIWLRPCLGAFSPNRLVISSGAQSALHGLLTILTKPGDAILVEPLAYPGLLAISETLGLRLARLAVDQEGVVPEALEDLADRTGAKILCLCPTLQNPTASTLSLKRRNEIAALVKRRGIALIEDDAYGLLPDVPLAAVAQFAPEQCYYISTLAKHLSPGLRLAYVVCPTNDAAERLSAALRTISIMPSPLSIAVVSRWIREGQAHSILSAIRQEAVARRALAGEFLPGATGGSESLHVWLDLSSEHAEQTLQAAARERGLSLVTSSDFCRGPSPRAGVRLSLGGPKNRLALKEALSVVHKALHGERRAPTVI